MVNVVKDIINKLDGYSSDNQGFGGVVMNKYQKGKEKTRNEAIDWQVDFANHNYSYGELADGQAHFEKLGKRYGLTREFKENGII